MEEFDHKSGYRRKKLPSLVSIATHTIGANINYIQDIGTTPFHLLESVLSRMNAKQLNNIETLSPHIALHSDKLWIGLIEKDFPTRPTKLESILSQNSMPYKALYNKYAKERELFQKDSTDRLRKITQRLEKEKQVNKVTLAKEMLKDPTIRRRPYYHNGSGGRQTTLPKPNTILGKVRKDLRQRHLIFNKQHLKPYTAFDAFRNTPLRVPHRPTSATTFANSKTVVTPLSSNPLPEPTTVSSSVPVSNVSSSSSNSSTSPNPVIRSPSPPQLKKRRSEPSIFLLSRNRNRIQSAVTRPKSKPKPTDKSMEETLSPTKVKAIKSSIFS